MKRNILLGVILAFAFGIALGRLTASKEEPNASLASPPTIAPLGLVARLDSIDATLRALAAGLGQNPQLINSGRAAFNQTPPAYPAPNHDGVVTAERTKVFTEVKGRILSSLSNPDNNLNKLVQSADMRSLTPQQQDEIMQEVANRINSGQLSKEQFLPGYRPNPATR